MDNGFGMDSFTNCPQVFNLSLNMHWWFGIAILTSYHTVTASEDVTDERDG